MHATYKRPGLPYTAAPTENCPTCRRSYNRMDYYPLRCIALYLYLITKVTEGRGLRAGKCKKRESLLCTQPDTRGTANRHRLICINMLVWSVSISRQSGKKKYIKMREYNNTSPPCHHPLCEIKWVVWEPDYPRFLSEVWKFRTLYYCFNFPVHVNYFKKKKKREKIGFLKLTVFLKSYWD